MCLKPNVPKAERRAKGAIAASGGPRPSSRPFRLITAPPPRYGPKFSHKLTSGERRGLHDLRWWRRNDDFEWKEYVRTTVLVRRQHRRDKLDAAKVAAVEGVKEAGRKGLKAGVAGAEAAGQAAAQLAKSAAQGAAGGAEKGLALAVRALASVRERIASASEPLTQRLSSRRISLLLAAIAAIAGIAFAVRVAQFGTDGDTLILLSLASAAGAGWLWPRLFSNSQKDRDDWNLATERVVAMADAAPSHLPLIAAGLFAAAGLWFAAPMVLSWLSGNGAPSGKGGSVTETAAVAADGSVVKGNASVSGAGLLRVGSTLIRLEGITLLDFAQTCVRNDGTSWNCGAAAKKRLEKVTRGRRGVSCVLNGEADGARLGTCTSNGADVAGDLVRAGFAFSDGVLFARYSAEESAAQDAKAGVWSGKAERPDAWLARIYEEAQAAAPGGCALKGRVQSGRKILIMPDDSDYARSEVRSERGDQWFCSSEEAIAAGFKPQSE